MAIRLGEHEITSDTDCVPNGRCHIVQDIPIILRMKHEGYDHKRKINDIALLKLQSAADTSRRNIRTICLPTTADTQISQIDHAARESMLISGWGRTENGKRSDVLLEASVPFVPTSECQRLFASYNVPIIETYLCAGGRNKIDTCHGDSGKSKTLFTLKWKLINLELFRWSHSDVRISQWQISADSLRSCFRYLSQTFSKILLLSSCSFQLESTAWTPTSFIQEFTQMLHIICRGFWTTWINALLTNFCVVSNKCLCSPNCENL